jgi:hypothetical protein
MATAISTAPKLAARCPGLADITSMINCLISVHNFGRSSSLNCLRSAGEFIFDNNVPDSGDMKYFIAKLLKLNEGIV